jgi:hypothetical protein
MIEQGEAAEQAEGQAAKGEGELHYVKNNLLFKIRYGKEYKEVDKNQVEYIVRDCGRMGQEKIGKEHAQKWRQKLPSSLCLVGNFMGESQDVIFFSIQFFYPKIAGNGSGNRTNNGCAYIQK